MEPESNSNQTVWQLAERYCKKAWGTKLPYAGRFCISLTVGYSRHYLNRFGRLPPMGLFQDFAVQAVEIQKVHPKVGSYRNIPNLSGLGPGHDPTEQQYWAHDHKVSDFDN